LIGRNGSRSISLFLKCDPKKVLRRRGFRLQLACVLELRLRLLQFTSFKRRPTLREIYLSILIAIVRRRKLTSLLQFGGPFLLLAVPCKCQAQLIVSFPTTGGQAACVTKLDNGIGNFSVMQKSLAERQVGAREVRSHCDNLPQLLDLLPGAMARTIAVGFREIELSRDQCGVQRSRFL